VEKTDSKKMNELINLSMECMGVAITIIDPEGILLYYNKQAAKILDRKPEYIGKEVYSHHMKAASSEKLESMIQRFRKGRTAPFYYEAKPYGKAIIVTLSPILEGGKFIGCTQSVQLKEDIEIQ
jgi:PAS domain S-box-containing protein